jgi:hypothetical protein
VDPRAFCARRTSTGDLHDPHLRFDPLARRVRSPEHRPRRGEGGKGDGPTGKALAAAGQPAPRDFTVGDFKFDTDKDGKPGTDADLKNVISKGALAFGGNAMMAPVVLNDADMANVIAFIRSLKK